MQHAAESPLQPSPCFLMAALCVGRCVSAWPVNPFMLKLRTIYYCFTSHWCTRIYLCIYVSMYLCIYVSYVCMYVCIYLSIYLSIHLSIYPVPWTYHPEVHSCFNVVSACMSPQNWNFQLFWIPVSICLHGHILPQKACMAQMLCMHF